MKNDKEKRLIRLLKIILTLDQGSVRVENLANEEGYSTRTIQRDIAALQAAGLPLIKKYNGSFAFVEDFNLRNITKTNAVDYSFLNEILNSINSKKADKKAKFAEKNNSIATLYAAVANKLYAEGNYRAALELYKRAFSFNKKDIDTKLYIAKTYIALREYEKALKVLQAPAETAEIGRAKALCYMNLEQEEQALAEIDNYFSLKIPSSIRYHDGYKIIDNCYRIGEYDKALKILQKGMPIFHEIRRNLYYLFFINLRLHKSEELEKHFLTYNKILLNEINSKNIYYKSLSSEESAPSIEDAKDICLYLNDKQEAIKYCKLLFKLLTKDEDWDISNKIVRIYNMSGLYLPPNAKKELCDLCDKAIKKNPSFRNYFARALVFCMFKDNQRTRKEFDKFAEYFLKEFKALTPNNTIFLLSGAQSLEYFYSYFKDIIPPSVIEEINNKAKVLKLKFAETVLKGNIINQEPNILAGRIFQEYGRNKEALTCFKRGTSKYECDGNTLSRMCLIYKQEKDKSNFKKYYFLTMQRLNEALYNFQFGPTVLWNKANFLYDTGNYKAAFLYFRKGLKMAYFGRFEMRHINRWKDKFLDCCDKLNENAAKEEFKYLYNTSAKYSLITRNG